MAISLQTRMDKEVEERVGPAIEKFNARKQVKLRDFLSPGVVAALGRSNVFLAGLDSARIMTSIPFYQTVFVALCHKCVSGRNTDAMFPLLRSGPVVPVLINSYQEYSEKFVKEIVKFPHFSRDEYLFYRTASVMGQSARRVCDHCVMERHRILLEDPIGKLPIGKTLIDEFFGLLAPFVDPDFALLDQFKSAVHRRDIDEILQLIELARTLNSIRTAQAFGSAQAIPLDGLKQVGTQISVDPLLQGVAIDELKMLAANELGLIVPVALPVDRYLEVVLPYQKRLSTLVDEIVEGGGARPYTQMLEVIQEVNSEVRDLESSKRFLAYRAVAGFAAGNSALIGGLLVSGALGVGGHLAGCGASLLTAIGIKFIKKWKPVRDNRSIKQLGRSVRASLQPAVAKVLAGYLGISTRAVEVWQLRQELMKESVAVPVTQVIAEKRKSGKPKTAGRRRGQS